MFQVNMTSIGMLMESRCNICAGNTNESLTFKTLSGRLIAKKVQEMISIDLPVYPPLPFVSNRVCVSTATTALRSVAKCLFCEVGVVSGENCHRLFSV